MNIKKSKSMDNFFIKDSSFKSPLSKSIVKEYNKLIKLLENITDTNYNLNLVEGTGGKVSVNNLIAYQIGWGNLLISWYNNGINDKILIMPGDGFSSWDYVGLAKHFCQKYKYANQNEQIKAFNTIVLQIVDIVEHEFITENLDKIGIWSWCELASGKQWPLSKWVQVNTVAPYKRASGLIRKI